MYKKLITLLLVMVMSFSLIACRDNAETDAGTNEQADTGTDAPVEMDGDYKIGIITGTVSQGEEEFQAAQKMKALYGDRIVTATYPDNFQTETETTISQVVGLASDENVKAIVFVQAVPGAAAAIDRVRETRPDMLFITGVVAEDPGVMAEKSDINFLADELTQGVTLPTLAKQMGAETYVHYSFARHLSYATIAARRDLMQKTCEELGINFVEVMAPDPTGDSGVSGAQQFILEDVPRQIEQYGENTAFFNTNCSMQEPLIRRVVEGKAIYPQQCCPSPYHAFPAALSIDATGHEGDIQYMLDSIKDKLDEQDMSDRISTWTTPVNMAMVEGGVRYAIEFLEGRTNGRLDTEVLNEVMQEVAGAGTTLTPYEDEANGRLDNFFMIMGEYYDFTNEKPYDLGI